MTFKNTVIHIGGMRTASTFLQNIFANHSQINLNLKSRFFSYDPYFYERNDYLNWLSDSCKVINIDSDENYSLSRFKSILLDRKTTSLKSELDVISHDQIKMANRLKLIYPDAKVIMVIREQKKWIQSVYKHDIQHFGLDSNFSDFLESELGNSYIDAGDYFQIYSLYANLLGKANVKLFLFEHLQEDPYQFLKALFNFIGLDYDDMERIERKNVNYSNATIYLLRILNSFSEKSFNKPEKKFFLFLRRIISLSNRALSLIPIDNSLIFDDISLDYLAKRYKQSNLNLLKLGFLESDLKKYGYI